MKICDGPGGVFFRSPQPKTIQQWYESFLGIASPDGSACLPWSHAGEERSCFTVWSAFGHDTSYFGDSGQSFMLNFRVADLNAALQRARDAGGVTDEKTEDLPFGKFGWFTDLQGIRTEIWEPRDETIHFAASLKDESVSGISEIKVSVADPAAWISWYADVLNLPKKDDKIEFDLSLADGRPLKCVLQSFPRPRIKSGIRQELLLSYADPFFENRITSLRASGTEIPAVTKTNALFCDPDGNYLQLVRMP